MIDRIFGNILHLKRDVERIMIGEEEGLGNFRDPHTSDLQRNDTDSLFRMEQNTLQLYQE